MAKCRHCTRPATDLLYVSKWDGNSYEAPLCREHAQDVLDWWVRQSWTKSASVTPIRRAA